MIVELLSEYWHLACLKRLKTRTCRWRSQDYIKNTASYECLDASFPLLIPGCLGIIQFC